MVGSKIKILFYFMPIREIIIINWPIICEMKRMIHVPIHHVLY